MPVIRTPDQRVRVFISSTLKELADERRAAREAVGQLRLTPVFFEAGARPHPPRDLYSAYLAQSHIFLGIYWNSYGWVAPGAEISGLEDEYRLSGRKPRLIYVKRSNERQPRLAALLADIERSDTSCYQTFTTADELGELIENDLSVLMSESFENAIEAEMSLRATAAAIQVPARRVDLPTIRSELIGREVDLEAVSGLLLRPETALVTLLGAGGTGKSTLAIHVAHRTAHAFADGAVFVPLAPVTDARLVAATVADSLGVQDSGRQPIEATLADYLADKQILLVLDNFEQVAEASRLVSDLLQRAAELRVLVTSRSLLHVRGERLYHLAPLQTPAEGSRVGAHELESFPATNLFVRRAREVNPDLQMTAENAEAIVQICQRLDGLPLAIELAAARTRFFQPAALTARLGRTLDLVARGHRDLPERQQTLRAAIQWSYDLLAEESRRAFRQLGMFRRSWTLEAADAVLSPAPNGFDVEEVHERLMDVSLLRPVLWSDSAEPRFTMLQTVHEYALEALLTSPEATDTGLRYAEYYRTLCVEARPHLWGPNSEAWLDRLESEYQNVRASFHLLIEQGHLAQAWSMVPSMAVYWAIRGGFSEGLEWIREAGLLDIDRHGEAPYRDMDPVVAGEALTWAGLVCMMLFHLDDGFRVMVRAEEVLRPTGNDEALAYALVYRAGYGAVLRRPDAVHTAAEAGELVRRIPSRVPLLMFLIWSNEHHMREGALDAVEINLREAHRLAADLEIPYMSGSVYDIQTSVALLQEPVDWKQLERDARAMIRLFPEKGYKGLKSVAYGSLSSSLMMQGKPEEAGSALCRSIELAREAGVPELVVGSVLRAAQAQGMRGNHSLARRLLGAADHAVATSGYPLVGGAVKQHEMTREMANPDGLDLAGDTSYLEGTRLRLDEAAVLALLG